MKVKELIRELQKKDPNAIICAGYKPIHFIEQMESYWNGYVAEVINDEWIYNTDKDKVVIHLWDESDFVGAFFEKFDNNTNFNDILPYIKNIPKDIKGNIKECYLLRFKKAFEDWIEDWKKAYEELDKEKEG